MGKDLTFNDRGALMYFGKPCSKLIVNSIETPEKIESLEMVLEFLKKDKTFPEDAHLISGIDNYFYDFQKETLVLNEKALFYPSEKIEPTLGHLFGPMTGVITHCYDPRWDVYAFQVRGQMVSGVGNAQTAAAGFGKYGEEPSATALRELEEELGIKGELVLPKNTFLDITPFKVRDYPQLLFSYITKADLTDLECVISDSEFKGLIEKDILKAVYLEKEYKNDEVAYAFTVPIKILEPMINTIEDGIGFFGPMKESINSFLEWYYKN